MIVIKTIMDVIPGKQREMMQTLISMIEPTAKAAGCISFRVLYDIEDKNRFCLLGEWKNREYLDHHIASHQFSVLLGTKALLREPLETQIFTISHSEGMAAIHTVRNRKRSSITPLKVHGSLIK